MTAARRKVIRSRRRAAGLTQAAAAALVGVSLRTWCRWEGGEYRMPAPARELFWLKTEAMVGAPTEESSVFAENVRFLDLGQVNI